MTDSVSSKAYKGRLDAPTVRGAESRYRRCMKLVVIWLVGVPLAVIALCTAAAMRPRATGLQAAPAAVTKADRSARAEPHFEHVLPGVRR